MEHLRTMLGGLCLAAVTACGSSGEPPLSDERPVDEQQAALDVRDSTFRYYTVRHDARKCVWPMCGGVFVKAVNRALTACVGGSLQPECYAATTDYGALGLGPAEVAAFEEALLGGRALVRATLHRAVEPEYHGLGQLGVREGWRAGTDAAPRGTFYRLDGIGLQCFGLQSPCVSIRETELNGLSRTLLSGVDLRRSGASTFAIAEALAQMSHGGILAAGSNRPVASHFPVHYPRRELFATQFYLRVVPTPQTIPCGGFIGRTCPTALVCDITVPGACHGADLPGVCKAVPHVCVDIYQPVCGCDGKTYGNDCARLTAGAQLDHDGVCVPVE